MTRTPTARRDRITAEAKDDEGISLIELLVVVIIVGILAAIAFPIYFGVEHSAKDSTAQADLTDAQTAPSGRRLTEHQHPPGMPRLPQHEDSLLVRTDFTDDSAWASLVERAEQVNGDGFRAFVVPVSDQNFRDADWETIRAAVRENDYFPPALFIADVVTLSSPERPVLVVDLRGDHPPFRCATENLWDVDNNLSISNVEWDQYVADLDEDGVYRGW